MEDTVLPARGAQMDWERQRQFALRVRGLLGGQLKSAFIHTYGCQQNVSDSEHLAGMLAEMGYRMADDARDADLVLFNTCAVREHAEQRVFGNLGALKAAKARRPGMVLALCGCMASEAHVAERVRAHYPYVDLVFGTGALPRLPELLYRVLAGRARVFSTEEQQEVAEGLPVRREGTLKAWLPVMQGCNNFCTYCIVPYVRGREHSRTPGHVLEEARRLAAGGYKEITLLGQNVNSYGKDLQNGWDFARLLDAVCAIEGDFRVHFMTSHPKDASHRLLETIAANPKVSRRLHLPFQSGSDHILKAMNRGYTAAQYLALVEDARRTIPGICLTSDVIVGFPGETEADFTQTLSLVEHVGFANLYTFLYSKRRGTPAEKLPDDTPREEKTRRFARLLAAQEKNGRAFLESMVGQTQRVLAESVENGVASGKADCGVAVRFPAPEEAAGQYCNVRVASVQGVTLVCEQADTPVRKGV